MAISSNAGFSTRDGASLSTDLGQALSIQLSRFMQALRRPRAATDDNFSGPSFVELVPDLVGETSRR